MHLNLTSDDDFLKSLTQIVESNLSNENFDVKELADKTGMNRTQIHRKLKSINNKSVTQFVREVRLNKARELLVNQNITVSDLAYMVGFSSPSYFIKCFREYFGYPPGEFKKSNPDEQSELETQPQKINPKTILLGATFIIILSVVLYFAFKNQKHKLNLQEKSIAVLPFKNLSGKVTNQYFADGMMEDILNFLFWVSDLNVVSRTTSEQYRYADLTTRELADALNVRYILEGSVRQQNEMIRISVQLIDANSDVHIWSEMYDRKISDVFGVQSEIAIRVANELNAAISADEMDRIRKLPTLNNEAYDAYLKGRFLLNKSYGIQRTDVDRNAMQSSIQFFKKAIELDSSFVEAYTGLANVYAGLSGWGFIPGNGGWVEAAGLIDIALMIDPNSGSAHALKGAIYFWGGARDYDSALDEFKKALKLDPYYPPLYQWFAQVYMITGPLEEARKFMDKSLELEPYYWVNYNLSAYIHYFENKFPEAIEDCQMAYNLNKDYIFNNWLFFLNYAKLGEDQKAVEQLQFILESYPNTKAYSVHIPEMYKKKGIPGLIKWIVEAQVSSRGGVGGMGYQPYIIAWWYALLKDREKCLLWLEKCPKGKSIGYMTSLVVSNPDFDFLRDEPRFVNVLEEIGVAKYQKNFVK